jgi:hypothetical protein
VSGILALCLIAVPGISASPCALLQKEPDPWVETQVDKLVQSARRAYESDGAIPAYEKVLDGLEKTIRRCKLTDYHDFQSRYRILLEYLAVVSLERKPDHELGFLVPDQQYFAETRQFVEIPQPFLSQPFLRLVSRYETLESAKSFLRQLNLTRDPSDQLIFFSYKSRHLGTPDNTSSYRRLLIVVPGNSGKGIPDKWVQFGVPDPGKRAGVRNVSIVSAMGRGDGTFDAYFKDYYRTYRRDGVISLQGRWELGEGDDNCTQCHKSGILPIFPVSGSVSEGEQASLRAVNERFLTYGIPRFGRYLDGTKLGPGLSTASSGNREQRFGPRFGETSAAKAMVCSSCHNSQRLGALNWPMDKVLISSYINGGQMPRGHQLNVSDRSDLYTKLIQEYFAIDKNNPGILKSWLLGKPEGSASGSR